MGGAYDDLPLEDGLQLVDPRRVGPKTGDDQRQTPFFDLDGWVPRNAEASRTRAMVKAVRNACLSVYDGDDGNWIDLGRWVDVGTMSPGAATPATPNLRTVRVSGRPVYLCAALCNRHGRVQRAGDATAAAIQLENVFRTETTEGGVAYLNEPAFRNDPVTKDAVPASPGVTTNKARGQYRRGVALLSAAVDNLRLASDLYFFRMWERSLLLRTTLEDVRKATDNPDVAEGDVTDFEHATMVMAGFALGKEPCIDPTYDKVLTVDEQDDVWKEWQRSGTAFLTELLLQYHGYAGTMRGKSARRRRATVGGTTAADRLEDLAWMRANAGDGTARSPTDEEIQEDTVLTEMGRDPPPARTRALCAAVNDATRRTFRDRVHERMSAIAGQLYERFPDVSKVPQKVVDLYAGLALLRSQTIPGNEDDRAGKVREEILAKATASTQTIRGGYGLGGLMYDVAYGRDAGTNRSG